MHKKRKESLVRDVFDEALFRGMDEAYSHRHLPPDFADRLVAALNAKAMGKRMSGWMRAAASVTVFATCACLAAWFTEVALANIPADPVEESAGSAALDNQDSPSVPDNPAAVDVIDNPDSPSSPVEKPSDVSAIEPPSATANQLAETETNIKMPASAAISAGAFVAAAPSPAYVAGKVNSRSYVRSGLIAQYDGIDNVGFGLHDSNATTWNDLTGNGNNGTCASASVFSWGDDGWSVNADCKPVTVGPGVAAVTATGEYTLQFVCTPSRTDKRECFFSQYANTLHGFGIEHNGAAGAYGGVRFYSEPDGTSIYADSSPFAAGEWVSASITAANGARCIGFWKNGAFLSQGLLSRQGVQFDASCDSVIGGEPWSGRSIGSGIEATKMAFQGVYNAFRVYDRALNETEIKINAAIDAIRFNGGDCTDWSEYPELDGFSFDSAGYLQVTFTAVADGGGDVRIGGGEPQQVAMVAFAYGSGAQSYEFTAVADPGSVFCRWAGDIGAITGGSCLDQTVTVSSAMPVSLVAVFKTPRTGLTSLSYVGKGLVSAYDGIDNAGFGSHNDSAVAWVNLAGDEALDGTVDAGVSWSADGWSVSENCKPVTVGNKLSKTTGTGTFTIQFACKPETGANGGRQCFFSQYDAANSFGIEHNGTGVSESLRLYSVSLGTSLTSDAYAIAAGRWASVSMTAADKMKNVGFFTNGVSCGVRSFSSTPAINADCASVIGGEPFAGTRDMAFRGKYNAFRLYDRVLTEDEIKVNSAVDAIRFNGASASEFSLGGGYSFAADGTLMADMSARADGGGKVSEGSSGVFSSVASKTVNTDGTGAAAFVAKPDKGFVFEKWTGDVDAIVSGTILTTGIVVAATDPVALAAVFRKRGTALDGMALDLEISSEGEGPVQNLASKRCGNLIYAARGESSYAYYTLYSQNAEYANWNPAFTNMPVVCPAAPAAESAARTCIYLPQYNISGTKQFNVRFEPRHSGVMGPVATMYVRFLWEGSAAADLDNDCAILMNGYNGFDLDGQGFVLRLHSPAKSGKGFPTVFVPGRIPFVDAGTDLYIEPNRWTDCFVSVYPSPTSPGLSNADIWFCQTPASSGGVFGKPVLKHRHLGDECALPKVDSKASVYNGFKVGAELSGVQTSAAGRRTAFRGAVASVKGWQRLLTEAEMWSVMLERTGDVFSAGVKNGSSEEFGVDAAAEYDPSTMPWLRMRRVLDSVNRSLTIKVPLPAECAEIPLVLEMEPLFGGDVGASCTVSVTANGNAVGNCDLMKEAGCRILLRKGVTGRDANGNLVIVISRPSGCAGELSFDAISLKGAWQSGYRNGTSEEMGTPGRGVAPFFVAGDPSSGHAQGGLDVSNGVFSILFDLPDIDKRICKGAIYETSVTGLEGDSPHRASIELDGNVVWSSENVTAGRISVEISAADLNPGLNELKWRYGAKSEADRVSFDFHRISIVPPSQAFMVVVK